MSFLEKTAEKNIPDARIEWKGKSEELKETSNELFIIFALALITAFLVLKMTARDSESCSLEIQLQRKQKLPKKVKVKNSHSLKKDA